MSETVRRVKFVFLMIELVMMLGVPAPRRFNVWRERRQLRRQQRARSRAIPAKQRALETLLAHNPHLTEPWRRSTTITRKVSYR